MKGLARFYHTRAIDSWMKYLFMKSKNMYSPLTLDLGNIDFWSTSLPPVSGPPVSQLWWLKGISASLFKCLLICQNFHLRLFLFDSVLKSWNSPGQFFLTCTQKWSQHWPMRIYMHSLQGWFLLGFSVDGLHLSHQQYSQVIVYVIQILQAVLLL